MLTDVAMHPTAGFTKASRCIPADDAWRDERFACIQLPCKIPIIQSQTKTCIPKIGRFGDELPVAAPCQGTEPNFPLILIGVASIHGKPWVGMVAGGQPSALEYFRASGQYLAAYLPL